jgi:hypothetical protein
LAGKPVSKIATVFPGFNPLEIKLSLSVSKNCFVDNVRPFVFFHNGMISFSTKYFISYGTPGSEIKTVFLFHPHPWRRPHLIVKHGAFGRNKSLVLLICVMGRLETFYNFGNLSQNFLSTSSK